MFRGNNKYIIQMLTDKGIYYIEEYSNKDIVITNYIENAHRYSDITKARKIASNILDLSDKIYSETGDNVLKITIKEIQSRR